MTWSTLIKQVLLDNMECKNLSDKDIEKITINVIKSVRSSSGNYVKESSKN